METILNTEPTPANWKEQCRGGHNNHPNKHYYACLRIINHLGKCRDETGYEWLNDPKKAHIAFNQTIFGIK